MGKFVDAVVLLHQVETGPVHLIGDDSTGRAAHRQAHRVIAPRRADIDDQIGLARDHLLEHWDKTNLVTAKYFSEIASPAPGESNSCEWPGLNSTLPVQNGSRDGEL
jgi:hypothetical protein